MINKFAHITGIMACIGIIAACFMPWTYYQSIQQTFTGFNVVPFPTGNYYGKAGIPITVMAGLILFFAFISKIWAKRTNLFLAGVLVAYTIRTYIIFTSALFEGEVEKFAGIYLVIILSVVILITTLFPNVQTNKKVSLTDNTE